MSLKKEELAWKNMWARCTKAKNNSFHNYGGRGISVCSRWRSLDTFLKDMGPSPVGTELERVNNDLGYFPENCRWATKRENAQNRRNTKLSPRRVRLLKGLICSLGSKQTKHYQFKQLARIFGITINSVYNIDKEICWTNITT